MHGPVTFPNFTTKLYFFQDNITNLSSVQTIAMHCLCLPIATEVRQTQTEARGSS